MIRERDRPKKQKKSFEDFKRKLKQFFTPKTKASKKQKPKAKKASFKDSFNKLKSKIKNAFKPKAAKSQKTPKATKNQNGKKPGKVDITQAVGGVAAVFAVIAVVALLGGVGGTKTVNKNTSSNTVYTGDINGVVREYQVAAGENISAGDFVEFVTKWGGGSFSGGTNGLYAYKLSENRVFLATQYTARILTFSDKVEIGESVTIPSVSRMEIINESRVFFTSYEATDSYSYYIINIVGEKITVENVYNNGKYVKKILGFGDKIVLSTSVDLDGYKACYQLFDFTSGNLTLCSSDYFQNDGNILKISEDEFVVFSFYSRRKIGRYKVGDNAITRSQYYEYTNDYSIPDYSVVDVVQAGENIWRYYCTYSFSESKTVYIGLISYSDTTLSLTKPEKMDLGSYTNVFAVTQLDDGRSLYIDRQKDYTYATIGIQGGNSIKLYEPISSAELIPFGNSILLIAYTNEPIYRTITVEGDEIKIENASGINIKPATSSLSAIGVAKTSGKEGDIIEVYCVK